MKNLPISIQTFSHIIEGDMIYVDKTEHVHNLVSKGKYYFLSRPRRFGKSLLLTTLKAYFEGKKELFKGLFLEGKEKEWKKYPVIHIDYSLISYMSGLETFQTSLLNLLRKIAASYGLDLENSNYTDAFVELTGKLHDKHGKVVLLVDEYDKAMVDSLTQREKFSENRSVLHNLYGAVKGLDDYFRFVMLTGVSRFGKVNIFSGMNNLEDISENPAYATITGFTQSEIERYFRDYLQLLSEKFTLSSDELMTNIKYWYNGFSFDGRSTLYNPFSALSLFSSLEFGNYWFSSGTPTFLIDLIKKQKELPENFENLQVTDLTGSTDQIDDIPLYPLLYQTGYLTIESMKYDGLRRRYTLNYPNWEVRESFIRYVVAAFVGKSQYEIQPEALKLRDALSDENPDEFIKHLQSFFSDIPYQLHISAEAYYHSLTYMILRLVGMKVILEKSTDKGRIDAVLELPEKVYIIEFKFAVNSRVKRVKTLSEQALKQIENNKYYEPYLASGKKIILFGVGWLDKKAHGKIKVLQT